jgi:hypothetical protein
LGQKYFLTIKIVDDGIGPIMQVNRHRDEEDDMYEQLLIPRSKCEPPSNGFMASYNIPKREKYTQ